ncbi:MAG: type I polyketide synthase, partial [Phycisphaerae bacterium]
MTQTAANQRDPIAIVGMSCLFPDARGLKDYWRLIRRREDAIRDVPPSHWQRNDYFNQDPKTPDHVYCTRGGFLDATDFDPMAYGIPPATLEAVDTAQLLGLVVAEQALNDAGFPTRDAEGTSRRTGECGHPARTNIDRSRVGITLGVTGALEMIIPLGARLGHPHWRREMIDAGIDPNIADQVVGNIANSYVGWQENSFPGLLGNVVAGRIANRLNLHGTNCVVDAACASSLSALHLAMMELQTGRADMMVTGGVDTFNDIFMFMCFAKTQALSKTGDAKPFDAKADGTVLGEGIGMLVLKRLSDAERDNDKIYAVIKGLGTSSDGRSQSIYAPRAEGQARCLRNAYADAGVSPASVGMVEAHGTGTKVGDAVEFEALKNVYREASDEKQWAAIGSVKSQIGHAKAAAGVASLVKAVLALQHRVIPPTIKVDEPNEKLEIDESPFYLATEARPWFTKENKPRRAGVSSFGFGGSNFHAIVEEYPAKHRAPAWDGAVEIIALSANSRDELVSKLQSWQSAVKLRDCATSVRGAGDGASPPLPYGRGSDVGCPALSGWETETPAAEIAWRAAQSREQFDAAHSQRLIIVLERGKSLPTLLSQAADALQSRAKEETWQLPNIFFGSATATGKLAFLFPGQGAQYPNMARDLVCTFPQAHDAIAESDAIFGGDALLSQQIYPRPTRDAVHIAQHDETLRDTAIAQPALGAVSLAMLRVLEYFNIKPDAAAGHSFGELPALRAAGRIGDEALRMLSKVRGALMGEEKGDRGTMLAVQAPAAEIDALINDPEVDVVLASRNGPEQSTLSGAREAIQNFNKLCDARGWPSKMLNVAAAFHSKFMNAAQTKFAAFLKEIDIHPGKIPVYANLTGL